MNYLKTGRSHLLIWAILASFSKYGRMNELPFDIVQDIREMFLESITIGFEPEHFEIFITSDRD